MKILYLTYYFEPDLCAGSFRNTAIVAELARQLQPGGVVQVVTTQPNRYQSFSQAAPDHENLGNVLIDRVAVPAHASGMIDQIRSFTAYYRGVQQITENQSYDLVVVSSSRLFTAFLGARLARKWGAALFLDIRDLFRETIVEILRNRWSRVPFAVSVLNALLWFVERYTFGSATHINLVSEGFRSYFSRFPKATYSYYTNGIDDEFIAILPSSGLVGPVSVKTILYAGNVGEGQGLHTIIPQAARQLGDEYRFVVIGDGGAMQKLKDALQLEGVDTVELRAPVTRRALVDAYQEADYLFVHLNDLTALTRVLPSKLFDYGATDKPILAGVAGYAADFIRKQLPNSLVFAPGDVLDLVAQLRTTTYRTQMRFQFRAQFGRGALVAALAAQIRQTAPLTLNQPISAETDQLETKLL